MNIRSMLLGGAISVALIGGAAAQTAPTAGAGMPTPFELPAACGASPSQAASAQEGMSSMQGMAGGMDAAHKAYMETMSRMNPAMMKGMMAKDTDVAFACSMLAHHMGAIAMAQVEIKYGSDTEAKHMAEKIVKAQEAEVVEFKAWLQKHGTK